MLRKMHIAVEGTVAVGKTTLLPKLHSVIASHNIDIDLVLEPVDKWVNWEGENESWNLLDMMYKIQKKLHLHSKWRWPSPKYSRFRAPPNHTG